MNLLSKHVYFLAHPFAGDEKYGVMQNHFHIHKLAGLCFDAGLMVIAPYYLTCLVLDDRRPDHRLLGMNTNDYVIRRLGHLLLTGHKLSRGMEHEQLVVEDVGVTPHYIIDLIDVPDRLFAQALTEQFRP